MYIKESDDMISYDISDVFTFEAKGAWAKASYNVPSISATLTKSQGRKEIRIALSVEEIERLAKVAGLL